MTADTKLSKSADGFPSTSLVHWLDAFCDVETGGGFDCDTTFRILAKYVLSEEMLMSNCSCRDMATT